jgi:hypothetical protein
MASLPATATRTAMAHGTAKRVALYLLGPTVPAMAAVNPGGSSKALRKPNAKVHMFHCVCSVLYHLRTLLTTEWDITGHGDSYEAVFEKAVVAYLILCPFNLQHQCVVLSAQLFWGYLNFK